MQVKYNMVVDFARPSKSNTILVAENDANSRKATFTLLFDKAPFDMSDVVTATILGITSTGARIYADATIEQDDEGNNINVIYWVIPAALTDTAGNITLTVTLADNLGGRITSFEFYVKVRNALYNEDDYIDEDDLEGFRDLLNRTRAALEKMEQMVQQEALPNPFPIRISVDNVDYEYNGERMVEILMGEVAYLGPVSGTVDITADDSAAAQAARSAAEAAESAEDAEQAYTDTRLLIDNFQSQIPTATVTKNIATHQSIIVITDKNGTTTAVVEDGVIGSSWYAGTDLVGTTTGITGYAGYEGDYYLNVATGNVYRCTFTGDISTALWDYVLTMGANNFGTVNVNTGSTTTSITAAGADTLEIAAGTNITLVPDNVNKKITIHSTGGGGGSSSGDMLKAIYDQNNNGIVDKAETLDDGTVSLTASISELNYVDGVTSAIQTQLDGKAAYSHTHAMADIVDLAIPDELADLTDDSTHRVVTDTQISTWDGKQDTLTAGTGINIDPLTNTISATAPSIKGYKRVTVAGTNIDASQAEDSIEFIAGTGMTITPDAVNKTVTFVSSGGGGSSTGDMLKMVYDQNNNGIVDKAETLNDGTTALSASIVELNYSDGVTSNIQDQLNAKAAATHTHVKTDITDFPTIPTALIQLDCTGDSQHRVVTDAEKQTWNNKQNALTAGPGVTITGNTISAAGVQSDWTESDPTDPSYIVNKPTLGDLALINIDSASSTKVLQGDGTWINPPAGYDMIPNNTAITSLTTKATDSTDDDVASGYAIANWSNAEITTLMAHIDSGDDTVGAWNDAWETDGIRTGWVWHECLYHTIPDNEVEISIDFDIGGKEVVGLYAYRVDDEVAHNGVNGGAIAIKLTSPIQNASGVDVAINLKRQRTNLVTNPTILS
jgi:hypothetical protein